MTHFVRGIVARQAHVDVPEGTFEEEIARDGFFGRASHLYRRHPPVGWTRIEGALRPRAYQASELGAPTHDWIASRVPFLEGEGVRLSFARMHGAMPYAFRNADADEVLFVHQGRGRFESDFGALTYETGHYLVIPRGVTYRLHPSDHTSVLVIETASEVRIPDRGLLGRHALFDPEMCEVPEVAAMPAARGHHDHDHELRVQRGARSVACSIRSIRSTRSAGRATSHRSASTCATSAPSRASAITCHRPHTRRSPREAW
jgi:homogentisate 1,2-dioxygenase